VTKREKKPMFSNTMVYSRFFFLLKATKATSGLTFSQARIDLKSKLDPLKKIL